MRPSLQHRYAPALPVVALFVTMLVGGLLNSVDAHGVVQDLSTGAPVGGAEVTFGSRNTVTGPDGSYAMGNLPRGARLSSQPRGYGKGSAPADGSVLELPPLTLSLLVVREGSDPQVGVPSPEVRRGDRVLGKGTVSGSVVVAPYPEVGATLLICAAGYESREIQARGITQEVPLKPGGAGCPPLPSPSPLPTAPGQSPQPPPSPAPSPSPSPTASPPAQ